MEESVDFISTSSISESLKGGNDWKEKKNIQKDNQTNIS